MRTTKSLLRFAFISALVLSQMPLAPSRVQACSCAIPDHAAAVLMFDASFRGRVTHVERDGDSDVVTFTVLETFRGVEAATRMVTVRRYAEIAPCPIPSFTVGEVYRVYADRNAQGLRVHFCNPSARVP